MTVGAGVNAFEAKMGAKAIPLPDILALIQALVQLFSGTCPKPTTRAQIQAIPFKRLALATAYRRQTHVGLRDAFKVADAALEVLDSATEKEVAAFLSDLE